MSAPANATPSISIILVTYNGWSHTRTCLENLLSQTLPSGFEIIVVDNGSSDNTPARLRADFPSVKVIESGGNVGFGAGCNIGLREARGEFCLLLNNDAVMLPEQIESMLEAYARLGLHGIYTARIVDNEGVEEASCFRDIKPAALLVDIFMLMSAATRRHTYTLAESNNEAMDIAACSGALCLFPRDLFVKTGGFDESFFMYFEDMDLCRRARALGYGVYANSLITVRHACGGSTHDNIQRAKVIDNSQRIFYRKHYGSLGIACTRIHQFARSVPRALVHGLMVWDERQRNLCKMHARLAVDALLQA
jgi:N-acetylglucosaminyl-diphospho-decaprenol L-rhamnosyltransferase